MTAKFAPGDVARVGGKGRPLPACYPVEDSITKRYTALMQTYIDTTEVRFWARVNKNGPIHPEMGQCWLWTGAKQKGYGVAVVSVCANPEGKSRNRKAHRMAYELLCGPIPEGLQLDHLCRNPSCVNPSHLEPVTCKENLLRGHTLNNHNAHKTHCWRGHPFDQENTYVMKDGGRLCKACAKLRRSALVSTEISGRGLGKSRW